MKQRKLKYLLLLALVALSIGLVACGSDDSESSDSGSDTTASGDLIQENADNASTHSSSAKDHTGPPLTRPNVAW